MTDSASLVKEKIDVVDFLGQYLKLTPAGKNFKAICPFHKEKTPSLMISPDKQIWHCFGCGNGGDVIKFLMLYENLEFFDALKVLAEKAGVNLDIHGGRDFKIYDALYKVMEAAKEFYRTNLYKSDAVKDYLKNRGLKGETAKEFELGAAPDEYDALTRYLLNKKFNIADLEKAGLVFKTERGNYWDRFRGRLMFPLYNHVGKVVGFTGRILPKTRTNADETRTDADLNTDKRGLQNTFVPAKYVNSPETPIFQKSKILYGFHKTKNDIREQGFAVLVEGQMDFLMMRQDGIKNVVATSGTALTPEHLKTLKKITDELVLSFDADEAGQTAAERSIDLASGLDFSVKLLIIADSDLKDPADVAKEKPGMLVELIKSAKPAMEYYFYKYLLKNGEEADFKKNKQNLRIVLSKIKNLASPIEKNHWIKELAGISKIEESVLMEEMENIKEIPNSNAVLEERLELPGQEFSRRELICQRLIGLAMNDEELNEKLKDYLDYFPDLYKKIYNPPTGLPGQSGPKNMEGLPAQAGALEKISELVSLRFSFENYGLDENKLKKEFSQLIKELKMDYLKEKQQQMGKEIDILEKSGNDKDLAEKIKEFDSVSREIHNMKAERK